MDDKQQISDDEQLFAVIPVFAGLKRVRALRRLRGERHKFSPSVCCIATKAVRPYRTHCLRCGALIP